MGAATARGGCAGGGEGEVRGDGVFIVKGTRLGMIDMGGQCFKGALPGYLDSSYMNSPVTEWQILRYRRLPCT